MTENKGSRPTEDRSSVWRDIFQWQPILATVLGVLLILASEALDKDTLGRILTKDVGFALLVAVFVWIFFEIASRKKQEKRIDERIERITKNVFFGVFRRDLPKGLVDEASVLVLEANIVREDFHVRYTLEDRTTVLSDGTTAPYVSLRAFTEFTLRNISNDTQEVPLGVGLPNPILPELRAKSDVLAVRARKPGSEKPKTYDLTEARENMRREMADDQAKFALCIPGHWELHPKESVHVVCDYVMAKEVEDTEVLQSKYPSDGLKLTIVDTNPDKRVIRARSIHRKDLYHNPGDGPDGTSIFSLDYDLLPYQGVVIWWKNRPPPENMEANQEVGEATAVAPGLAKS